MHGEKLAEIRRLWDEGRVFITPHAHRRMRRRGFDLTDLQHVIRHGHIAERNRPRRTAPWRYRLDGLAVDGAAMACVVTIDGDLIIITTHGWEESS